MNIRELYDSLNNKDKAELMTEYCQLFSRNEKSFYNAINRKVVLNEKQLAFFSEKFSIDLNLLKDEFRYAEQNKKMDSSAPRRRKKRSGGGTARPLKQKEGEESISK